MLNTVTAEQRAGYQRILGCAWCTTPLGQRTDEGRHVYDCRPGCRTEPIDGAWLDDQILRALAGKIRLELADTVLDAIRVASATPVGVRLVWKRALPHRLRPDAQAVRLALVSMGRSA